MSLLGALWARCGCAVGAVAWVLHAVLGFCCVCAGAVLEGFETQQRPVHMHHLAC